MLRQERNQDRDILQFKKHQHTSLSLDLHQRILMAQAVAGADDMELDHLKDRRDSEAEQAKAMCRELGDSDELAIIDGAIPSKAPRVSGSGASGSGHGKRSRAEDSSRNGKRRHVAVGSDGDEDEDEDDDDDDEDEDEEEEEEDEEEMDEEDEEEEEEEDDDDDPYSEEKNVRDKIDIGESGLADFQSLKRGEEKFAAKLERKSARSDRRLEREIARNEMVDRYVQVARHIKAEKAAEARRAKGEAWVTFHLPIPIQKALIHQILKGIKKGDGKKEALAGLVRSAEDGILEPDSIPATLLVQSSQVDVSNVPNKLLRKLPAFYHRPVQNFLAADARLVDEEEEEEYTPHEFHKPVSPEEVVNFTKKVKEGKINVRKLMEEKKGVSSSDDDMSEESSTDDEEYDSEQEEDEEEEEEGEEEEEEEQEEEVRYVPAPKVPTASSSRTVRDSPGVSHFMPPPKPVDRPAPPARPVAAAAAAAAPAPKPPAAKATAAPPTPQAGPEIEKAARKMHEISKKAMQNSSEEAFFFEWGTVVKVFNSLPERGKRAMRNAINASKEIDPVLRKDTSDRYSNFEKIWRSTNDDLNTLVRKTLGKVASRRSEKGESRPAWVSTMYLLADNMGSVTIEELSRVKKGEFAGCIEFDVTLVKEGLDKETRKVYVPVEWQEFLSAWYKYASLSSLSQSSASRLCSSIGECDGPLRLCSMISDLLSSEAFASKKGELSSSGPVLSRILSNDRLPDVSCLYASQPAAAAPVASTLAVTVPVPQPPSAPVAPRPKPCTEDQVPDRCPLADGGDDDEDEYME